MADETTEERIARRLGEACHALQCADRPEGNPLAPWDPPAISPAARAVIGQVVAEEIERLETRLRKQIATSCNAARRRGPR